MKLTLQRLLEEGEAAFRTAGITEAVLDAKYLLLEAFSLDMAHFLMDRGRELQDDEETKERTVLYKRMVEKRAERIPISQITGSREFMGLDFLVDEHVLIPRQDTETLVEAVLKDYKGKDPCVLDMCTGSGCIAVSLAVLGGYSCVVAADLSEEALKIAEQNVNRLAGGDHDVSRVSLRKSDLFSAFGREDEGRFDVIVSNPPYIKSQVIDGLEPEVRDHEPRMALDGREDGLHYYRRLAAEAGQYLKPGGAVYYEIGYDQAEEVCALLEGAGYGYIRVLKDAPGLDRVVTGVRC